jgi:hypothetical protein
MSNRTPVPVTDSTDNDFTLKSCATEVFRWVRAAGELIEASPMYAKQVADDLAQAWHDSAKR